MDKIPAALSESSLALFPPLEHHEAAFPKVASKPSLLATSRFESGGPQQLDSSDAAEEQTPATEEVFREPYPESKIVRGDSYQSGISLLAKDGDEETEVANDHLSRLMLAAALSYPPPPHKTGPIVIVCSYTQFGDLAHGPRGSEASRAMRSYRLNITDGSLTLLSALPEGAVHNPAFCRRHPSLNVLYTCTESVKHEGQILALQLDGRTGALQELCAPAPAGGTSTCYMTIHKDKRRMLAVNYWDSTVVTLELMPDGKVGSLLSSYDPKQGKKMKACADGHVNHSRNDDAAQAERQGDPHSHAIVLEPTMGTIAFVPDLGCDLIRQFHFDEASGVVTPCGQIVSGVKVGRRGLGPRYLIFAKDIPCCYAVNELSSQVAVFKYDPTVAAAISTACSEAPTAEARKAAMAAAPPTLTLVQTVSTVPEAFPRDMNTCGRVTIHPTGDFVVTSNRGHDSVAVHRIHRDSKPPGMLTLAGIFHTRGETPRHFQFDKSGQWLLVANQDSDTCAVFAFSASTGRCTYTGNTYKCPSPNFVCVWDGA